MKHELLLLILLLPAIVAFVLLWTQKCFKETNEENIKKFCDALPREVWPRITGTQTKKFTVYMAEHRNALKCATEEAEEITLFGKDLEEELLKRAKERQKDHPFYLISPIAILKIKVMMELPKLKR